MKSFWNERYSADAYVYGMEPNAFFREQLDLLTPGKILLPAEGEGRNAVYAASCGWDVTAYDYSEAAQQNAMHLAAIKRVKVHYLVGEFHELCFEPGTYDAVGLCYAHLPAAVRGRTHKALASLLKPGGTLMLEAFSAGQSEYQKKYGSGGPQDSSMLYTVDAICDDFSSLDVLYCDEVETELAEGSGHIGLARVIRFVGRKH